MSLTVLTEKITDIAEAFELFKKTQNEKLDALQLGDKAMASELEKRLEAIRDRVEELESRGRGPGKTYREPGMATPSREQWIDQKSGDVIPVLGPEDRLADLTPNKTGVSVGRFFRALLTGRYADDKAELDRELKQLATTPDASGGYTVPAPLAAEFIDALRAATVLNRVGARTVPRPARRSAWRRWRRTRRQNGTKKTRASRAGIQPLMV